MKKDKELILQDICARLLYGLRVRIYNHRTDKILWIDNISEILHNFRIEDIKPYLRPMSSMTPDERFEYDELNHFYTKGLTFNVDEIDWLNAHYFDYRGLIEKGLALEAPEGMYK